MLLYRFSRFALLLPVPTCCIAEDIAACRNPSIIDKSVYFPELSVVLYSYRTVEGIAAYRTSCVVKSVRIERSTIKAAKKGSLLVSETYLFSWGLIELEAQKRVLEIQYLWVVDLLSSYRVHSSGLRVGHSRVRQSYIHAGGLKFAYWPNERNPYHLFVVTCCFRAATKNIWGRVPSLGGLL